MNISSHFDHLLYFVNSANFEKYSMTKMISMFSHISFRKKKKTSHSISSSKLSAIYSLLLLHRACVDCYGPTGCHCDSR